MSKSHFLFRTLVIGAVAVFIDSAHSQILYSDTNTFTGNAYNYAGAGGVGSASAGNEIILAGGSSFDLLKSFAYEFDFSGTLTGNEAVELTLFANSGKNTPPTTALYTSGFSTLSSLGVGSGTTRMTLTESLGAGIVVPQDFIFEVTFTNISSSETAGLSIYYPPTVGSLGTTNDWQSYPGGTPYTENSLPGQPALSFGAQAIGIGVPDSSSIWVSLAAVAAGFYCVSKFVGRPVKV